MLRKPERMPSLQEFLSSIHSNWCRGKDAEDHAKKGIASYFSKWRWRALRIFLSKAVMNCSRDKSFSTFKMTKNYLWATVCTGYTPLLEHFTVIGLSHNFTVNCETFFNFSHSCKPLQAAISFQQALDSIVVSEGLLNFVYVFAFHDIMNQNSIDTAEGNPVDEEVVIYFDENVALNISAEKIHHQTVQIMK
ncbi:hypothetical protein DAPPUDRAFT_319016 [Daphnia pulex]|uniref:Uncharacterized protein n=1 Tax=Daphnia pulex TaxID=6669 RepID=E9GKF1_DAPPU|nr:hypothetical protein DAPPUDRAFT_319016 [Daphnia pulex]|eukprot:EFX80075.1 hypothetical protein DAPPUDRAFT_319016 [Daphnia pulex]